MAGERVDELIAPAAYRRDRFGTDAGNGAAARIRRCQQLLCVTGCLQQRRARLRAARRPGTRIEEDGKDDSTAVIHVITDSPSERILTVSTLNVPTEYELTYLLKFSVTSGGHELIAPEEHRLVGDYSYSESALLAKEREKSILSEALANDLVSVVMRRLSSLPGVPAGTAH